MSLDSLMNRTGSLNAIALLVVLCWLLWGAVPGALADNRTLPGHVPAIVAQLTPLGDLPPTNQLHLALGVTLRDAAGLDSCLAQVYAPASPRYHHYMTPQQFTDQFGPAAVDYQSVMDFARSNHLAITATHGNRLLLDVTGAAADIQQAFHVHLRVYRHPTEARNFFAPDTEPSVDSALPLADISGLSDFSRPHPHLVRPDTTAASHATPRSGSGSGGTYGGNDFRAAYLPGVTLTGTGQSIGMVEFDGYYASDISTYESTFGLPAVPLQTVLLDGYDGTPTTGSDSGNPEVSLDIEMAVAIAPGLSNIVLFEAGPSGLQNDILNSMAANPQIHQLSCSWGWTGGPNTTTDNIFKEMSAQGQSFFNAAGDSDAFTTGASSANGVDNPSLANAPSSCPYITVVGGTTLTTTGPGGSWSSETVWNWGLTKGSYVGGSGGISSSYVIPSWQAGVSMAAHGGSTTYRNTPDVALTADNIFASSAEFMGRGIGFRQAS
jgi:subtilase family serine protease